MFLGHEYRHRLTALYTTVFGNLFNDLKVLRYDDSGTRQQVISVPLHYGPRDKWIMRLRKQENLDDIRVAITLPMASFQMTNMTYDGDRKLPSTQRVTKIITTGDNTKYRFQYVPVPYNFEYELSIYTRYVEDGLYIIEQILPFFTPEHHVSVKVMPEMELDMDIPIVLNGITNEDIYENNFEDDTRVITWTLNFNLKGYLYGPIQNSKIIKKVQVDSIAVPGTGPVTNEEVATFGRSERLIVTPGLTANGQPTSNANLTIPYRQIDQDDNYGIVEQMFFYTDGKKYDPKKGVDE